MELSNRDPDVLQRRMERYGSCMASVRLHIQEILFLQRTELLPLLQSMTKGGGEAESKTRGVHIIRYIFLNLRFVIEQLAFGMALAHYDSIEGQGLLNWKPKTIITALQKTVTEYYPEPVRLREDT